MTPQPPQFCASLMTSRHAPPQQRFPGGHAMAHEPQWATSFARSWHAPLQLVRPVGQQILPAPPGEQNCPVLQPKASRHSATSCRRQSANAWPTSPSQLRSLMHSPYSLLLHPLGAQAPLVQTLPREQAFAQAPQFSGSDETSTHLPLQLVSSGRHWQTPPTQTRPPEQVRPQAPQLFESFAPSWQTPPQQRKPPGHWRPQLPQCPTSELRFRQVPAQLVCPWGQQILPGPPGEHVRPAVHPKFSRHSAINRLRHSAKACPTRPSQLRSLTHTAYAWLSQESPTACARGAAPTARMRSIRAVDCRSGGAGRKDGSARTVHHQDYS